MARKKNPSTDIPTPEETVIEGTAEHVEDHENDTAAGTASDAAMDAAKASSIHSPRKSGSSRMGRWLTGLCVVLALLAALAGLGLTWINRLAVQAVNTQIATLDAAGKQQDIVHDKQLAQLSEQMDIITNDLDLITDNLNADDNADIANQNITALENRIAAIETALARLENQPSTVQPDSPPIGADDIMIMAQQLAELEQRVRMLENQTESQITQPETTQPDIKTSDPRSSGLLLTDTILDRARTGQPYADLLDQAMTGYPEWVALQPWADAPPKPALVLWNDLEQILSQQQNEQPVDGTTETPDQGWWSWLMAPLNDAVTITPITPEWKAIDALSAAWQQRDADQAIEAIDKIAELADQGDIQPALAKWREAMIQRQALDKITATLYADKPEQ
ncbi:MAG: hypothetical protein P8N97_06195 [Alphaproteobacteria bacterium]|nr:hypothetical protein [Alphaproteobacteria bacterium]